MGKDLGMSPAQLPAVSVMGSVQVPLGFIQLCLETLQGWRGHSLADWAEAPDGPTQWSKSFQLADVFLALDYGKLDMHCPELFTDTLVFYL